MRRRGSNVFQKATFVWLFAYLVCKVNLLYYEIMNFKFWTRKKNNQGNQAEKKDFDVKKNTETIFWKYQKTFKDLALYDKGEQVTR